MRKRTALTATIAAACLTATGAVAAEPENPGCFGQARGAYANEFGSFGHEVPGVGFYASDRAGDNGEINREFKEGCGG
jgi:hypothetical protein